MLIHFSKSELSALKLHMSPHRPYRLGKTVLSPVSLYPPINISKNLTQAYFISPKGESKEKGRKRNMKQRGGELRRLFEKHATALSLSHKLPHWRLWETSPVLSESRPRSSTTSEKEVPVRKLEDGFWASLSHSLALSLVSSLDLGFCI